MRTMFNLLRMDLRRLFRTRSFYIVLAAAALLSAVCALATSGRMIDLYESGLSAVEYQPDDTGFEVAFGVIWGTTQLDYLFASLSYGFSLMMSGIGVTLFVRGDFSSGRIRNICHVRPRRWEYVLSKILTAGVYSGILAILGVLAALIVPLLCGHPELYPAASPIGDILQYTVWQWLLCGGYGLMGLAVTLLTRKSTLGIFLPVFFISRFPMGLLEGLERHDLAERLLSTLVTDHSCVPMPGASQISIVLGWAALYAAVSFLIMQKRDI